MITKGIIKKGQYFDSVSLMMVAKEINKIDGVMDSAVVMGTKENKSILKNSNMLISDFESTSDSELLIVITAENEKIINDVLTNIDSLFKKIKTKSQSKGNFLPKSLDSALSVITDANLSLISIAGKYAGKEAMKALKNNLNVMLFSDNVSIQEEIELKKYAKEKGLLVMGPDCGTAIINGIPLAFANVVNRGNIGIVAASGTGLQEISSIISNEGAGISQAIGTGGRDVKKDIGGIMFIEALKALSNDDDTKVIVLVSKPPYEDVLKKIADEVKHIKKPVVAIFIGGNPEIIKNAGAIPCLTLEETAIVSTSISKGTNIEDAKKRLTNRKDEIKKIAEKEAKNKGNKKYIRGLFSGGTLCDEAQLIFKDIIGYVYSNTPLNQDLKLQDSWKSVKNTVIDLGEDEFTVGRPHPMIDYSLRNRKIIEEAKDNEVGIILLDVVLGYGSNMKPSEELAPIIKEAKSISPNLSIICSITGTDKDPQDRNMVKSELEKAGAIVMPSNASASELTAYIHKLLA